MDEQQQTLRGTLTEYKVFTADGWGRGVVRIDDGEFPTSLTVIGRLLNVRIGDSVELNGSHQEHPKFGPQFQVKSCTPVQPITADGVVRWMASRLPDVGANRARAMVEAFGDELWTTIEKDPLALTRIDGITPERAAAIATAYAEVAHEREHMSLLRGWGLTEGQIARAVAAWGELCAVVDHVRADPYELGQVVDGFGFKRADKIAMGMGIARDAPGRVRAAILHLLDVGASEGHCYIAGAILRDMACRLLGVDKQLVIQQIFAVCELKRVVRRGWRVYSARLDKAEASVAASVLRLLGDDA